MLGSSTRPAGTTVQTVGWTPKNEHLAILFTPLVADSVLAPFRLAAWRAAQEQCFQFLASGKVSEK